MNTPHNWLTTAHVTNPERKAFWESIFGGDTVPILSILPQPAILPGSDQPQLVYMLDLGAIHHDHKTRLVNALAQRFGIPIDQTQQLLQEHGVPIQADDVDVSSSDHAMLGMFLDDDFEPPWCDWCACYGHHTGECDRQPNAWDEEDDE